VFYAAAQLAPVLLWVVICNRRYLVQNTTGCNQVIAILCDARAAKAARAFFFYNSQLINKK
jgi:hypothetical protein